MSIQFKKQNIRVNGGFALADEIQIGEEQEKITDIIIEQLTPVDIKVPVGYSMQIYDKPFFDGNFVTIYSDCDWITLQQICSVRLIKQQQQPIATIQFKYDNHDREIRVPVGLYLCLGEINMQKGANYLLILDSDDYVCERYSFGFQIYGTGKQKIISIKQNGELINIYKCFDICSIQNNIFAQSPQIQIHSKDHKIILFEKNNYEGAQLHIVADINLCSLGNVGSLRVCSAGFDDKFFKHLKIQNYTQSEPKILLGLLFICSILTVLKLIINARVDSIISHNQQQKNISSLN